MTVARNAMLSEKSGGKRTFTEASERTMGGEALEDLAYWIGLDRPLVLVGTGSLIEIKRVIESLTQRLASSPDNEVESTLSALPTYEQLEKIGREYTLLVDDIEKVWASSLDNGLKLRTINQLVKDVRGDT